MKISPKSPVSGLLDDPELLKLVEHIKFEGNESKTRLHRYLALRVHKMHGELNWKDKEKYWSFLASLDAEEMPKSKILCDRLMEKLNRPDERAKEVEMLIRQPIQLSKDALKVKKSRWRKQLLQSKIYSLYEFEKLIQYYTTMGMIHEHASIYNLQIDQVYMEINRLRDKLAVLSKSN